MLFYEFFIENTKTTLITHFTGIAKMHPPFSILHHPHYQLATNDNHTAY